MLVALCARGYLRDTRRGSRRVYEAVRHTLLTQRNGPSYPEQLCLLNSNRTDSVAKLRAAGEKIPYICPWVPRGPGDTRLTLGSRVLSLLLNATSASLKGDNPDWKTQM